jgi:zinc transport system substrate-binding protein
MQVTVSIFPIYDLVRRVAGPDADVTLLVPPGRWPYGFTNTQGMPGLTDADTKAIASSRVAILTGSDTLDSWMADVVKERAPKARILKLEDRVPTLFPNGAPYVEDHREGAKSPDPYVWLDPDRAAVMTKAIGEELARADSAHAAAYRRRTDEVVDSLDALDKKLEVETKTWQDREIATEQHEAFVYFADRYHLHVVSPTSAAAGSVAAPRIDVLGGSAGEESYEALLEAVTAQLKKR